jgi:3,4-dihydroxy 2-butanone 4-phosphate synthase / GTP cyclohydrolase II
VTVHEEPRDGVDRAVRAFAAGEMVVVVDDVDREHEADLVCAADSATSRQLAFLIRHTSGIVCVPMLGADLDRLDLPLMVQRNEESLRTAFTVSVDARRGTTTGVSAAERAVTIRALADPGTEAGDLVRPGHIFPLRYEAGGVLSRRGHTEATVDLATLASRRPAGVLAELVNDDGTMMRGEQVSRFARLHGLVVISIEALVLHRKAQAKRV